MADRPNVPSIDPMAEYANFMVDRVEDLYAMVWLLIVFVFLFVVAFLFFGYQKWMERKAIRDTHDEVRKLLLTIKHQGEEVRNLLALVRGWAAINSSTSDRAVIEVKEEINKVPDTTAAKVMEGLGITEKPSGSFQKTDFQPPKPSSHTEG
jgi:hypothetical protein